MSFARSLPNQRLRFSSIWYSAPEAFVFLRLERFSGVQASNSGEVHAMACTWVGEGKLKSLVETEKYVFHEFHLDIYFIYYQS